MVDGQSTSWATSFGWPNLTLSIGEIGGSDPRGVLEWEFE